MNVIDIDERRLSIPCGGAPIAAELAVPDGACGLVLFVGDRGRRLPQEKFVATWMTAARPPIATCLLDLRMGLRDAGDSPSLRDDLAWTARRIVRAAEWLLGRERTRGLPLAYFGAGVGAAAALVAAADRPELVRAVVSLSGRPDLAEVALAGVATPTLLLVGQRDEAVEEANRVARTRLAGERRLDVILAAGHELEEPGALEEASFRATAWLQDHLLEAWESRRDGSAGPPAPADEIARWREDARPRSRALRGPHAIQRSDARIFEDVCESLARSPDVDASDLEVVVEAGEVTLRGTVEHRAAKRVAEDLAEAVPGVRDVHNALRIRARAPE